MTALAEPPASIKMIQVEITPDMLDRAKKRADKMGRLKNSITNGKGTVAGFLGEEMVLKTFNNFKLRDNYDSDVYFHHINFEVKTKRCTSAPLPHYDCSIAKYNPNQKAEYYIFCRILNDYKTGWITGYILKKEYFEKCIFLKKGDYDPRNDYYVKADCYNLPINNLKDAHKLFKVNDFKPKDK